MALDYKNAELPELLPLQRSFTQNEVEEQSKALFLDVFKQSLSEDVFDVNVLGAAHLGSFELVRRSINSDGLVLLFQGDSEEAATRYLYRAWKSRNTQGRGLHFLRTYLQLLFPNVCDVYQLWQKKDQPYPTALSRENEIDNFDDYFLTSRIEVALDFDVNARSIKALTNILRSVVPARITPNFRFLIIFDFPVEIEADWSLYMDKYSTMRQPWCGRVVTNREDAIWYLGKNGSLTAPRLTRCRIRTDTSITKESLIMFPTVHHIPERGLKVDGSWKVYRHEPISLNGTIEVIK